jgi:hypothetical protein
MLRRDWVRTFVIRLAIVYVLLVLPWPGINSGFSTLYRSSSNLLFGVAGLGEYFHTGVPAVQHPRGDVELAVTNPQTGARLRIEYGSRDWAYLSLAAGLALTLAVPSPWPGRLRSGILLMGLILLFVLARIAVAGIYGLGSLGAIRMSPAALKALGNFMLGFSATPISSFVVPVLLWLLVNYRWFEFGSPPKGESQESGLHGGTRIGD